MLETKIKTRDKLKGIVEELKKQKKRVVFTNGCFDIVHYGHVKCLEDAKSKGDILIVAVNSDASVKKIKGPDRPIVNQDGRSRVIAALESVDYVMLFDEETPYDCIKLVLPDILVKGGDWGKDDIVGSDVVQKNGGKVVTIPVVEGYSTTEIINKAKRIG